MAVYPSAKGFAFVLFEGPRSPFDWGISDIASPDKNAKIAKRVERIIERFHPDVLVCEKLSTKGKGLSRRLRDLHQSFTHLAEVRQLSLVRYSRQEVRACFASVGARTKQEIALAIAREIPEFAHRIPPYRKVWMSQDRRQSLFDAASLGITYFAQFEAIG